MHKLLHSVVGYGCVSPFGGLRGLLVLLDLLLKSYCENFCRACSFEEIPDGVCIPGSRRTIPRIRTSAMPTSGPQPSEYLVFA